MGGGVRWGWTVRRCWDGSSGAYLASDLAQQCRALVVERGDAAQQVQVDESASWGEAGEGGSRSILRSTTHLTTSAGKRRRWLRQIIMAVEALSSWAFSSTLLDGVFKSCWGGGMRRVSGEQLSFLC